MTDASDSMSAGSMPCTASGETYGLLSPDRQRRQYMPPTEKRSSRTPTWRIIASDCAGDDDSKRHAMPSCVAIVTRICRKKSSMRARSGGESSER